MRARPLPASITVSVPALAMFSVLRGAVFRYDAFVHGQARLCLVEDAAALHKRGIAGHAAAHQDHRAVVGDATAGVQRGIAADAAALHDQGAPVHYTATVVVIAAGDAACAHAVPKDQARAGLDVDGGPRIFVPLHAISIQRMPVQVQRQSLAGGNVEGGLRFQRRQVAGQDDDRPALRPIDGLLERRPAVDAGIRPRRDGEKQCRQQRGPKQFAFHRCHNMTAHSACPVCRLPFNYAAGSICASTS